MKICCLIIVLSALSGSDGWSDIGQRKFKDNFLFGVSTSAYQVEGAWDTDGKGESVKDKYFHDHPEVIADGRNGDVACDSYHLYHRDVEMLRELGVDFYRFSISWPRVLPTGHPDNKNEKGFQYYHNLIDELLKYNIEPMITLYHFDLPQTLQDLGGWENPSVTDWFEGYARTVFDRFASKVKYWITINQPNHCLDGYGGPIMPPGVGAKGIEDYMCVKNMMVAHAKVYRLYEKEYKSRNKGSIGISLAMNWFDPVTNSTENFKATEEFRQFNLDLFMNPIWSKNGDFPRAVIDAVAKKSTKEGHHSSRLPKLSTEEINLLKGAADFLGVNHYTTFLVSAGDTDQDAELTQGSQWPRSSASWLKSAPYGLYKLSLYINKQYNYPGLFITEHGWSTEPGLGDTTRVDNLKGYLSALLLAIEDGTDVKGYTAWSLMDNVEWTAGTSQRFGLYEVDFESEDKKRTARQSALFYKNVIETRVVDQQWKAKKNSKIQITKKNYKTEL